MVCSVVDCDFHFHSYPRIHQGEDFITCQSLSLLVLFCAIVDAIIMECELYGNVNAYLCLYRTSTWTHKKIQKRFFHSCCHTMMSCFISIFDLAPIFLFCAYMRVLYSHDGSLVLEENFKRPHQKRLYPE
jgi:hypothetical protein